MLSVVTMTGGPGSAERTAELRDALTHLVGAGSEPGRADSLPEWLTRSFSAPLSREEKEAWLATWRAAGHQGKAALEQERGWELGQWLYWFSPENDIWTLAGVSVPSPGVLQITLEHSDEPFLTAALAWLAEVGGFEMSEPVRMM